MSEDTNTKTITLEAHQLAERYGFTLQQNELGLGFMRRDGDVLTLIGSGGYGSPFGSITDPTWSVRKTHDGKNGQREELVVTEKQNLATILSLIHLVPDPVLGDDGMSGLKRIASWGLLSNSANLADMAKTPYERKVQALKNGPHSIVFEAGFELYNTGGSCLAFRRDFPDGHWLITDSGGTNVDIDPDAVDWIVGQYVFTPNQEASTLVREPVSLADAIRLHDQIPLPVFSETSQQLEIAFETWQDAGVEAPSTGPKI